MKTKSLRWWLLPLFLVVYAISSHGPLVRAQKTLLSEKDVLPILEKKCFQCHGEALKMSNLDLRTREGLLKGGDNGPVIVPGKADDSQLYRRVAGLMQPKMPMTPLPALTEQEVTVLKDWINDGANWGSTTSAVQGQATTAGYGPGYKEKDITDQDRNWWAFRQPVRSTLPTVSDARWTKNPIDHFVRAAMTSKGLTPAPQANRATLIRRATLDLTGLLPTPEEVDQFVNDPAPNAYENVIERLLASPHYGERWGRFWLDVVRYADSSGYELDMGIDNAWRYRDYVIGAFNQDKPYNQFVIEQLAGDEVDNPSDDSLIATTFYRLGPRVRNREKDNPSYRFEYMDDVIRTTFQGFMGLSVHCARCHDHKFDPITRADYYRSMAMFNGYINNDYPLAPKAQVEAYQKTKAEIEEKARPLRVAVARIEQPYKDEEFVEAMKKFPEDIQLAVKTPEEKRTPGQKLLAAQVTYLYSNPDDPATAVPGGRRKLIKVSEEDNRKRQELLDQLEKLENHLPPPLPVADAIRDGDFRLTPEGPGDEFFPGKGNRYDYGVVCCYIPELGRKFEVPEVHYGANGQSVEDDMKGAIVAPGYLKVLVKGTPPLADPPKRADYVSSGRRRALAEWMVSPENPLTGRVIVNRIWYGHFGQGIVATPGNFGKMGIPPSHPELLDWLTTEFVRQGWSIKQMHRLIMTSETYKMESSFYNETNTEKDSTNTFLWKYPIRRLEAEVIRDVILSASGKINLQMGGQPFFPAIPKSVQGQGYKGKWIMTKEEPDTWRRSIYAYAKRSLKFPMFEVHDQPDPNITSEKRNVSTVPTQALMLLNDEFILMQAQHFAKRVMREGGNDPAEQIKTLYRIALSRDPSQKEIESNLKFLNNQREYQVSRGYEFGVSPSLGALTNLAHVILNANEFVYIN